MGPGDAVMRIAEFMLACFATAAAAAGAGQATGVPASDPAWDAVFTRTSGWTAGDIGNSVALPPSPGFARGRTLWLFGDSFVGDVQDGAHAPGSAFVRNAAGWHENPGTPGSAPDEIHFLLGPADGTRLATSWLDPARDAGCAEADSWFWPMGDGVVVPTAPGAHAGGHSEPADGDAGLVTGRTRDRLVLFVTRFGPSGNPEGMWNFRRVGGMLAIIDNWRDDPGAWRMRFVENPLVTPEPRHGAPARSGVNWGAAAILEARAGVGDAEPRLFVFGVEQNADGEKRLVLARVPAARVEDFALWEFLGPSGWGRGGTDLAPLCAPVPDEFSIERVGVDGAVRLVMIHSEAPLGRRMMARAAPRPEGPWSDAAPLLEVPRVGQDPRLLTYAHKAHGALSAPGELLVSYVINSTDFGQVVGDATLYRPRFLRVRLGEIPRQP